MTLVSSLINKERLRNQHMIEAYNNELAMLPKGSIRKKILGNKIYYYLTYRDGKKVISKYIGKNEQSIEQIRHELNKRIHVEEMLKKLKIEQIQIKKMEELL